MAAQLASVVPGAIASEQVTSVQETSAAPVSAPGAGVDAVTAQKVLANGLRVIVREDHRAPTVAHLVWYRTGSLDERSGATGLAHVLEHMMFKGTRSVASGEFSRRVAAMGGRENAFTTPGYTCYFQRIPTASLADVMRLEADRMANLVVTRDAFSREIKVVMEERRLRTEDRAGALVREALMASAFVASPIRTPVIGWMSDLESMTVDDVSRWYRKWYTPANAVVVVAGDVVASEVFALAQDIYGGIESRELPARRPQAEPAQRGIRQLAVKAPAENPMVLLGFKVPRLRDLAGDDDVFALYVLAAVLDGDENGRLTRRLVRDEKIASAVQADYDMLSRVPGLFVLGGRPSAGHTTQALSARLRLAVSRIAEQGVDTDELQRIKIQLVAGRVYQRDSVFSQAMEIGTLAMLGFEPGDSDRILERLAAVTPAQVQAVARRYFSDDTLTEVTLLPKPVSPGKRRHAIPGLRH